MAIATAFPKLIVELSEELAEVRRGIIRDAKQILEQEQTDGFGEAEIIVVNRGRQSRRKLSTLNSLAPFIKIGTKNTPFEIRFVRRGAVGQLFEAAQFAWREVHRVAPRLTGDYLGSIAMVARPLTGPDKRLTLGQLQQYKSGAKRWPTGQVIAIHATAAHAVIIEAGFFTDYYKTNNALNGRGIFWGATQSTRERYGETNSIWFQFKGNQGGRGTWPEIVIAPPGTPQKRDSKPGQAARRKRSARRKRIKGR